MDEQNEALPYVDRKIFARIELLDTVQARGGYLLLSDVLQAAQHWAIEDDDEDARRIYRSVERFVVRLMHA